MSSRIKIKVGAVEIEFEGPEEFLTKDLPGLLAAVSQLLPPSASQGEESLPPLAGKPKLSGTTGDIAARLGAKSGPDLILAATAHLSLVKGDQTFSRKAVHDEMRSAKQYYKKTYGPNLTKYLGALIRGGKLNEPTTGHYALPAAVQKDLAARLARA